MFKNRQMKHFFGSTVHFGGSPLCYKAGYVPQSSSCFVTKISSLQKQFPKLIACTWSEISLFVNLKFVSMQTEPGTASRNFRELFSHFQKPPGSKPRMLRSFFLVFDPAV